MALWPRDPEGESHCGQGRGAGVPHCASASAASASCCLGQLLLHPRDSGDLPGTSSWHTLSHKKLNYRVIKYLICLMSECLQVLMNSLL